METGEFLRDVEVAQRRGPAAGTVNGVHYDSRQVVPGGAFVAIRGEKLDGNAFIAGAVARGARLVVTDRAAEAVPEAYEEVVVRDARVALAQTAANWFHHPGERLRLIGITGTNGKTTTANLIEALLRGQGWTTGLLGTIAYRIGNEEIAAPHTTPESYDLQQLLARMAAARCEAAVMEVSSHALALERVWGLAFEVAVFTNLTQDHLDYHGTMERYREAKRRLFTGLGAPAPRVAVVNVDDAASAEMVRGYGGRVIGYGLAAGAPSGAVLRATGVENTPAGLRFTLEGPGRADPALGVASPLLGRVNAYNLLAAIGTGLGLGLGREAVVEGVGRLERVPGRFERVYAGQPFTVVVDYAHTPDALINVLALARELVADHGGRVLVVFGSGGERDRGKRPLMGAAAARGADWVMLTSDNPRSEDPEAILDEIAVAAPGAAREADRGRAIEMTLAAARAGDIVVIAGKGHERYQIVGDEQIPFADAAVAEGALKRLGW